MQFQTDTPVDVAVRAWTPFIPNDSVNSNIPGTVFEVRLQNRTTTEQKGSLVFSFSRPLSARQTPRYTARIINGRPGAGFVFGEPEYELPVVSPTAVSEAFAGDPPLTVCFVGIIHPPGEASTALIWGSHDRGNELAIDVNRPKGDDYVEDQTRCSGNQ